MDSDVTPVGTTQVWPVPAVENVTEQVVPPHTGAGVIAEAGAPVARRATPKTPTTEKAAVAMRTMGSRNLDFTGARSRSGDGTVMPLGTIWAVWAGEVLWPGKASGTARRV